MADFKQAIQEAEQAIETIILSLKKLDIQITSVSNNAAQNLGKVSQAISPNDMNSKLKSQQQLINNLNTELKNQKILTTELSSAKQKQKNITSEEIVGQRQLKKNADLQAQSTMKLVGAYQNLISKQRQARTTLKNLISSNKTNTKEIKKAQIAYNSLTSRVNKANKATSNFAKTGLGNTVRGFKNLLGAFGIVTGIQMFGQMVKNVFNLTRTLNSMNFAMKAVIKDGEEFAQTQVFLDSITENFGAELVTTTNRYIKFRAAAIQANFSAKETQDIFGTMTKAAGVLGLKTDELTGIFLALEQMISKGKITTEELRRQLGERLPGAMDIMAKSLGVTTAELDAMLKKGQVITKDVLPAFARQVEIAFGIQNVRRVDTLAAATSRMQNAWTNLIKDMEGSQGILSGAFTTILNFVTSILEGIGEIDDKLKEVFLSDIARNQEMVINGIQKAYKQTKDVLEDYIDVQLRYFAATEEEIKRQKLLEDRIRSTIKDRFLQNEAIKMIAKTKEEDLFKLFEDELLFLNKLSNADKGFLIIQASKIKAAQDVVKATLKELTITIESGKVIRTLADVQRDLAEAIEDKRQSTVKESVAISRRIKLLQEEAKTWDLLKDKLQEFGETNSRISFGRTIKALTIQRDKLNITSAKYRMLDGILIILTQTYKALTGEMDKNSKTQESITKNSERAFESTIASLKKQKSNVALNTIEWEILDSVIKALEITFKGLKGELEKLSNKELFATLTDTFADFFDIDISKFDFLFDSLENSMSDWADLSKELIGSVLDASLKRYELELIEAQRTRDLILENDLASNEEKENARKRFDARERQIKVERAKQERENTLIAIAVDIAAAIVKVTAQTGVLAPFTIPGIIAIGLAQAAIVASQPLPKFESGTTDAPKGWALTQEKRAEPITDMYGRLKTMGSDRGAMLTPLAQHDIVYKSKEDFFRQNSGEAINRAVWNMNMTSNGEELSKRFVDNSLLNEIKGLRKDNIGLSKEIKRLGSRPIKNNVTVEINDNRAY